MSYNPYIFRILPPRAEIFCPSAAVYGIVYVAPNGIGILQLAVKPCRPTGKVSDGKKFLMHAPAKS